MKINIVMVEPEIPQNTGNIARTCAATGGKLHLVEPLGFKIDDKYLKRAGLDYWDKLDIEMHKSLEEFLKKYQPEKNNMYFVTTKGQTCYSDVNYSDLDEIFLLYGIEMHAYPEPVIWKGNKRASRRFASKVYRKHNKNTNETDTTLTKFIKFSGNSNL